MANGRTCKRLSRRIGFWDSQGYFEHTCVATNNFAAAPKVTRSACNQAHGAFCAHTPVAFPSHTLSVFPPRRPFGGSGTVDPHTHYRRSNEALLTPICFVTRSCGPAFPGCLALTVEILGDDDPTLVTNAFANFLACSSDFALSREALVCAFCP